MTDLADVKCQWIIHEIAFLWNFSLALSVLVIKLFSSLFITLGEEDSMFRLKELTNPSAFPQDPSLSLLADASEGWSGTWLGVAAKRQLGVCDWCRGQKWGKNLSLWQLCLPVWTTSIFIAFENALMSVITTDYTTFFFFLLSVSTDMEWWNYSWCQGMRFFYALSKQNKTIPVSGITDTESTTLTTQTAPPLPRLLGSRDRFELHWTHKTPLELSICFSG